MSRATSKFGDYSVHIDWQQHKSGKYLFKQAKKDRKKFGELRKHPDGSTVFWIERRAEDLVFCKDSWAIDSSAMMLMRCLGKPDIGIAVSNGDRHFVDFPTFDANKYQSDEPKHRGKWFLAFKDWSFIQGEVESIEHALMIGKWK